MNRYISIDLGGTNVRVAKVDDDGNILQDVKRPSYALEGPERVTTNIIEMIEEIDAYQSCLGIGIGIPGAVDTYNRTITISTNLPGFTGYPLCKILEERFNLPTFMDNDANVAGLAEAVLGAGKDCPIVYYITHSTGIGGALVVDGKVVSGRKGYAGEIANIIVKDNGKKYNYLNRGAVENEASGTAIARMGKEEIGGEIESAIDVFNLARHGDERALDILDRISKDLAQAMADIAHVCDPHIFVIGGGCSNASDLYFHNVIRYYRTMVHEKMQDVPIVKAVLAEPGVIGAAMLVKSNLKK